MCVDGRRKSIRGSRRNFLLTENPSPFACGRISLTRYQLSSLIASSTTFCNEMRNKREKGAPREKSVCTWRNKFFLCLYGKLSEANRRQSSALITKQRRKKKHTTEQRTRVCGGGTFDGNVAFHSVSFPTQLCRCARCASPHNSRPGHTITLVVH